MRDPNSWNFSLGHWFGVHVRVHALFLVVFVCGLLAAAQQQLLLYGLMVAFFWFLSVLLHEVGHCVAAFKTGGSVDQIVLWPLGGFTHVNTSHEPTSERLTALAGPMVNLLFSSVLALVLFLCWSDGASGVLNPFIPPPVTEHPEWKHVFQFWFWINWVLFLVNLLPAFPLDGGRILRSFLWPRMGYPTAVAYVAQCAKVVGVLLVIAAFVLPGQFSNLSHAAIPLAILGVIVFFYARHELESLYSADASERLFDYDFSQGYTSLERQLNAPSRPGAGVRRWLENRRAMREQRRRDTEADEDRRMDDILARLHEGGIEALSPEDRALLDRVAARYRSRLRQ